MYNLIGNAKWCPSPCGEPMHFSCCGPITFDDCYLHENRTCSVTIPTSYQSTAGICYDLMIQVENHSCIAWGFCMRAICAENVTLRADFYDRCQELIATAKQNVCTKVCMEFQDVATLFEIPQDACMVQLSLEFSGTVTACTFCAPFAYFVE